MSAYSDWHSGAISDDEYRLAYAHELGEDHGELPPDPEELEDAMNVLQEPSGDAISRQTCKLIMPTHCKRCGKLLSIFGGKYCLECEKIRKADFISRQAVLEPYKGLNDDYVIPVWLIRMNIEQQPSVTPTERTGHWKYHYYEMPKKWECDKCGKWFKADYNYCPNCGCLMVKSQESEDKE